VRPWGLRGPRMRAEMRKMTASVPMMYLASIGGSSAAYFRFRDAFCL
jgi:hypothetical protein